MRRRGIGLVVLAVAFSLWCGHAAVAARGDPSQVVLAQLGDAPPATGQEAPEPVLGGFLSAMLAGGLVAIVVVLVLLVIVFVILAVRSQTIYRNVTLKRLEALQATRNDRGTAGADRLAFDFEAPPLAMPGGTVRAVIAVTIVLVSLGLAAIVIGAPLAGAGEGQRLPEIISAVLGTVLGFYFGTRGNAETKEALREATRQTHETQRQTQEAQNRTLEKLGDERARVAAGGAGAVEPEPDPSLLESVRSNARQVVDAAAAIAALLPAAHGTRLKQTVSAASAGLELADKLFGKGEPTQALHEARRAEARAEGSFADLISDAIDGVVPVVGGIVPGGAVVLGLVRLGAGLTGQAYERWRNQIVGAPHAAELFPPTAVSADVAMLLVRQIPLLRDLFAAELERGDRRFFTEFKDLALTENGAAEAARRFAERDATIDTTALAAAVDTFRGLVRQELVLNDVPSDLLPRGEVERVLGAVDQMATGADDDPALARGLAEVHKLVLVIEQLNELGLARKLVDAAERVVTAEPAEEGA